MYSVHVHTIHVHILYVHVYTCTLSSLLPSLPPSLPPVVQRIRTAPSPSTFVVGEDEPLRQQVLALLRKQERRAAAKRAIAATQGEGGGGGETGELRSYKKGSVVSLQGEERRKKKEKY